MLKDKSLIFVVLLAIIGFLLRVYKLGFQSLWMDEGFSINAAVAILKHGYPLLESGFIYYGYVLNTYIMAFFMLIFNNDIFGARLVSVVFGTLTIILAYYFGKELFDKKTGLLFAILITFSVWEIAWSRQARAYAQLQFFYLLSLLLFYRFVENKNVKNLILVSLLTFLTILSHNLGFTLIVVYIAYFIFNFKSIKKSDLTFLKNKYFMTIILPILFIGIIGVVNYQFINTNYLRQYFYYITNVHLAFFYLGAVGALILMNDFKKSSFLVLSYLIPLLFASYFIYLIHYRYLYFILPILFLLTVVAINHVSSIISKKFAFVISLVLIGLLMLSGFVFLPKAEYDLEKFTPQPDFEKTYNYILSDADNKTIIDAYPSLANIYLGRVDYGLKFSLSGREADIVNQSFDVYSNVPFIDLENLKILNSCYLVVDELSFSRIDPGMKSFISNEMDFIDDGSDSKNQWSGVKLYGCRERLINN